MTREEALERLEGTWSFDVVGDKVMIRELGVLASVEAILRERAAAAEVPRSRFAAPTYEGAAASGD